MNIITSIITLVKAMNDKSRADSEQDEIMAAQQHALLQERLTVTQLKKEIEPLLYYMQKYDNVTGVIIQVPPDVAQFVPLVEKVLECKITAMQEVGQFILESRELQL